MSPSAKKQDEERSQREKRERLAYIGTLAAGLVHEMRTPLNAIQLNAQLLEEDFENLPEKWRQRFSKRMGRISSEIRGIAKTLDGFLAFARPPRMDPVPTDLNHFLREVIEFSEPEFVEVGIQLERNLASDMYPVVLDKFQFTHVMLNLFRNAREACESRIEKGDEWAGKDYKPVVTVTTAEKEDIIEILVDDNGIGIEPDKEETIFDLFYTTKEKGSGLGLGIVRRIVDDHGGKITAEDSSERGARFRITLPRGKFLEFTEE